MNPAFVELDGPLFLAPRLSVPHVSADSETAQGRSTDAAHLWRGRGTAGLSGAQKGGPSWHPNLQGSGWGFSNPGTVSPWFSNVNVYMIYHAIAP